MTVNITNFLEGVPQQHKRSFLVAFTAALTGAFGNFRHGACVMNKKIPLVAKPNTTKTHPKIMRFSNGHFCQHAEMACLLNLGFERSQGKKLYVVRINNSENICNSKPCESCQRMIIAAGIDHVYYSTGTDILWDSYDPKEN